MTVISDELLHRGFVVGEDGIEIIRENKPTTKWDSSWMKVAKDNTARTTCFSRLAGSVIVRDYRFQVSSGFNGPPMGTPSPQERHPEGKEECSRRYFGYRSGGEGLWICPCAHSELNAIVLSARNGISTKNSTLYLYTDPACLPCKECAVAIIQAGINEVVVNTLDQYEIQPHAVNVPELFKQAKVLLRKPLTENLQ